MNHKKTSFSNSLFFSITIFRLSNWFLVPLLGRKPAYSMLISSFSLSFILSAMIFSIILLQWLINAIGLLLPHVCASPFNGIGINMDFSQSSGHSFFAQINVHSLWKKRITFVSPVWMSSDAISSILGLFPFLISRMAFSTSKYRGGGSSCRIP